MQASWDALITDITYDQLLTRQTKLEDRARLLAVAAEHVSDWLNTTPNPDLGLKLDNSSVRIACGLRLAHISERMSLKTCAGTMAKDLTV